MTLPLVTLTPVTPTLKIGDTCPTIEPNVTESCILVDPDGSPVGLFLKELPKQITNLCNIADFELRSDAVPKSMMTRAKPLGVDANGKKQYQRIQQYSTILGSCAPKPHMRRPYPSRSSVHSNKTAKTFVKVMNALGEQAFRHVTQFIPDVTLSHTKAVNNRVPDKWRFADHFTSTISNCNIAAQIHRDNANVKQAVNLIVTKRRNSTGGNLHVPDYDATFDMTDNSLLVYPAWRNSHGVTPIIETHPGGYRNSHVWYALDGFNGLG